jgi:hypothetical protein
MKVIGAGFGRTGTLSLKVALEELGFGPCYHMTELFDKPEHMTFWDEAADKVARGEPVDWEGVFPVTKPPSTGRGASSTRSSWGPTRTRRCS